MTGLAQMSYARSRKKAVTVRVPEERMRQLMRARKLQTQSALINTLLEEEAERVASRKALAESVGAAGPRDLDDRLL